jgi:phage protein D
MIAKNQYYAPTFSVKVNKAVLPLNVSKAIKQVTLEDNLNAADMFTFDIDNHDLRWIDSRSDVFAEGNEVLISLGYVNGPTTTLLGEITSLQATFPASGDPTLEVTGYDLSHRLMRGQTSRSFTKMRDSDIVSQIATEVQLIPDVKTTELIHDVVQESQSNFQFLKEISERTGFEIRVEGRKLYFQESRNVRGQMLILEWGKSLINFNTRLTMAGQVSDVEVRGWDPEAKKELIGQASQEIKAKAIKSQKGLAQMSLGSGGSSKQVEVDLSIQSQKQADEIAKNILKNITDKFITGGGSCVGMPEIRKGTVLELRGIGSRFNGTYYVTSSTHTISDAGYTTNFQVRKRIE